MALTNYINKSNGNIVNCYDQASAVYSLGKLLGIGIEYRFMNPFGYINTTNLVGVGNCNNPFYPLSTSGLKIAGSDATSPVRTGFGNHAFTKFSGNIYDACAGPQTGSQTEATYVNNVIDISTQAEANVAGSTSNISSGAVTSIN